MYPWYFFRQERWFSSSFSSEELGRCSVPANQGPSIAGVSKQKELIKSKNYVMRMVALLPLGFEWRKKVRIILFGSYPQADNCTCHLLGSQKNSKIRKVNKEKKDGKILQVIMQSRILRVVSREQNKTVFADINCIFFCLFLFLVLINSAKQK